MTSRDELWLRIRADAEAAGWWKREHILVAAVSGGPDSMAMLHLLRCLADERPYTLVAAHVNHRFRGAEAEAEAELVAKTAAEWDIALESAAIDVPAFIEETGMNAQAAAREKRYEYLRSVADKHSATHLLFGHHADDQAETVLMRVVRGTGVGGLSGIPYRRKEGKLELIRPLLRISKWELQAYCERNGVPFAVDSSNLNRRYFRNAVRLDLLPMLESYNPRLKESLIRLADMAEADDEYMEAEASRILARTAVRDGHGFRLKRRGLCGLHVALQRRLVKLILNYSASPSQSMDFRHIEEILLAAKVDQPSVTRMDIGSGWVFVREYDELYIGPDIRDRRRFRYTMDEPMSTGSLHIRETGAWVEIQRLEGAVTSPPDNRWEAFFDASKLVWPLVIRSREPGDRMEPSGLNGSKKVQDMFVNAKVPRSKRDEWPLVTDASGRVLWIPGLRRSRAALVGADTQSSIRIVVQVTDPVPRTTGT